MNDLRSDIGKRSDDRDADQPRRSFLRRVAGIGARAAMIAWLITGFTRLPKAHGAPVGSRVPLGIVRPPGALPEREFMASCVRCTRCADACPVTCIQYFASDAGTMQGTPYVAPIERGCTLCMECGKACPTGAIVALASPEEAAMGTAKVDERLCVSLNGTGVCGACYTACPLRGRAIIEDFRNAPIIHAEHCVGCGLCEEFCIVDEREGLRAIQVWTKRHYSLHEAAA